MSAQLPELINLAPQPRPDLGSGLAAVEDISTAPLRHAPGPTAGPGTLRAITSEIAHPNAPNRNQEGHRAVSTIEERRDVLRATVLPRTAAREYTATVNGTTIATMPWGMAMASAQKSIRNGADITAHDAGAFTLTAPNGGRSVRFQPA